MQRIEIFIRTHTHTHTSIHTNLTTFCVGVAAGYTLTMVSLHSSTAFTAAAASPAFHLHLTFVNMWQMPALEAVELRHVCIQFQNVYIYLLLLLLLLLPLFTFFYGHV